jgi:hypothetical protein
MISQNVATKPSVISQPAKLAKAFQHGVARRLVEGMLFFRDGEKG